MSTETATPEVLWAQRSSATDPERNFVYLTINIPDIPKDKLDLKITSTGVTFTGTSTIYKRTYHVELPLYAEIDPDNSAMNHTMKNVELKLRKKELAEAYWPRLLKEAKKMHFLKTDFDKWADEDEQNETADEDFSQFGGMGGMPGMGGGDFGGIDFSKLGGGGDTSGAGAADDDDDDDDMPPLEGEDEGEEEDTAAAAATAAATADAGDKDKEAKETA